MKKVKEASTVESGTSPAAPEKELLNALQKTVELSKSKRGRPSKAQIDAIRGDSGGTSRGSGTKSQGESLPSVVSEKLTALGKGRVLNPKVSVQIHQIYFKPDQKKFLDQDAIPYDNSGRRHPLFEYEVFRRLNADDETRKSHLWGAVSWKFVESMGFSVASFKQFIVKNPGYDVYFCNPHPSIESLYENLWIQGEIAHPNFLQLANAFLDAAGLDSQVTKTVVPSGYIASANYFVGSHKFWNMYLEFVDTALLKAEKNLPPEIWSELSSPVADHKGLHNGSNYFPFLIERLLTEFLLLHSKDLKAIKLQSPKLESKLSDNHRDLRHMKDLAVRSKSTWMIDCWRNYRNLYLSLAADPKALRKHLKVLTDRNVLFCQVS